MENHIWGPTMTEVIYVPHLMPRLHVRTEKCARTVCLFKTIRELKNWLLKDKLLPLSSKASAYIRLAENSLMSFLLPRTKLN